MRTAVVLALTFFLILVLSCVTPPKAPKPVPPDPMACPVYGCVDTMRYQIDPAFDPYERSAIEHAMQVWTTATGGRQCFAEGAGMMILRSDSAGEIAARSKLTNKLLHPIGLYQPGKIWLLASELSVAELTNVTAHEFGHAFGLTHNNAEESLMRPMGGGLINGLPSPVDRIRYCEIHACDCRTP